MTLAVGTALKNGTYVIDAWVADDTIGPVYLAMDVSRGQWIRLRVLGSRSPENLPDALEREAFYRYLDRVNGLNHGALPQCLGGFEEDGVCYQTLANPAGTTLDRLVADHYPLTPQVALAVLRQLVKAIESLRPLGWTGLRICPDQVWYQPEAKTVIFTGFDLVPAGPGYSEVAAPETAPEIPAAAASESAPETAPESAPETAPETAAERPIDPAETALVRSLTHLLYFLLTGQRAEATKAPLAVDLRRCHPALPHSMDQALEAGSPPPGAPPVSLADWVALLPTAAQLPPEPAEAMLPERGVPTTVAVVGHPTDHRPSTSPVEPPSEDRDRPTAAGAGPRRRSGLGLALVLTGIAATASGLGFGLYARLQPTGSTTSERLNPNQSFPPLPDWNGNDLWRPWNDAPALRDRPAYSDTPPPGSAVEPVFIPEQEPAAPPPAVSRPVPTPAPTAPPEESWNPPAEPSTQPGAEPTPADSPASPPPVAPAPAPAPEPLTPPAPLEAPSLSAPEGAAPPPLINPPRPPAPAPTSS
ncbi:hypothetical protein [Leptolyngbya sp. KIOST-1]|uniref:hypothetical protein n=1 Tax=Leptolyngbya sp. KIOST-1 TaxID=1229172 RepID=UPI0005625FC6|nr:hypothetical protein [Leptolyngbya sp. KIOST-1]